jgi:hypothetical protein
VALFFYTYVGINMIALLNKDGANISSAISPETPAGDLIEVRISSHFYRDDKMLTSQSASPIASVDA